MSSCNSSRVSVALTFDDGYVQHASVAIASLLMNANKSRGIDLYILSGTPFLAENESALRSLLSHHADAAMHFVVVDRALFDGVPRSARFPIAALYRIALATFLPAVDRCIYIDGDVVVEGDIAELYDVDLGSASVGAVPDVAGESIKVLAGLADKVDFKYCNSGVLVQDLRRIRELGLVDKFLECGVREADRLGHFVDQSLINIVVERSGGFKYLGCEWNFAGRNHGSIDAAEFSAALRSPKLIHFISGGKPWRTWSKHRYKASYWHYIPFTGFAAARRRYIWDHIVQSFWHMDHKNSALWQKSTLRILRIPLFRRVTKAGRSKHYLLGIRVW